MGIHLLVFHQNRHFGQDSSYIDILTSPNYSTIMELEWVALGFLFLLSVTLNGVPPVLDSELCQPIVNYLYFICSKAFCFYVLVESVPISTPLKFLGVLGG